MIEKRRRRIRFSVRLTGDSLFDLRVSSAKQSKEKIVSNPLDNESQRKKEDTTPIKTEKLVMQTK